MYYIPVYTIKDFNAEETRKRIQMKLDNGKYITDDDLTDITILTFMNSEKKPKEVLIDAINLINQVNVKNSKGISLDDINSVKYLFILLTKKFADNEEENDKIVRMIKMEGGLFQGAIDGLKRIGAEEAKPEIIKEARPNIIKEAKPEIIKEARPNIIKERNIEIAKELIKTKMHIKEIAKITEISVEEINEII